MKIAHQKCFKSSLASSLVFLFHISNNLLFFSREFSNFKRTYFARRDLFILQRMTHGHVLTDFSEPTYLCWSQLASNCWLNRGKNYAPCLFSSLIQWKAVQVNSQKGHNLIIMYTFYRYAFKKWSLDMIDFSKWLATLWKVRFCEMYPTRTRKRVYNTRNNITEPM